MGARITPGQTKHIPLFLAMGKEARWSKERRKEAPQGQSDPRYRAPSPRGRLSTSAHQKRRKNEAHSAPRRRMRSSSRRNRSHELTRHHRRPHRPVNLRSRQRRQDQDRATTRRISPRTTRPAIGLVLSRADQRPPISQASRGTRNRRARRRMDTPHSPTPLRNQIMADRPRPARSTRIARPRKPSHDARLRETRPRTPSRNGATRRRRNTA